VQLAQRILVSFILYSLYAPHPIAINPFKSVLFVTFVKEREKAVDAMKEEEVSPNEQLVWVLWKILKGDGNDVCGALPWIYLVYSLILMLLTFYSLRLDLIPQARWRGRHSPPSLEQLI
jgi:hypothetical protein